MESPRWTRWAGTKVLPIGVAMAFPWACSGSADDTPGAGEAGQPSSAGGEPGDTSGTEGGSSSSDGGRGPAAGETSNSPLAGQGPGGERGHVTGGANAGGAASCDAGALGNVPIGKYLLLIESEIVRCVDDETSLCPQDATVQHEVGYASLSIF